MRKLNIKGEFNFDNYLMPDIVDYKNCKRPMFHGTRKYSLEISEGDRQRFNEGCKKIVPFAKNLIHDKKIEFNFVINAVNQSSSYEYGDFYLTLSFTRAIDYSYYPGGELGHNVYKVCQEIINKNMELTDEIKNAIDIVLLEYEKYEKSKKIVLVFDNIEFKSLYYRGGSKFIDSSDTDEDVKEEIDELYDEEETQTSTPDKDFRLKVLSNYEAYIVNEKDFRKGIKVFTKINDVDKYIANHNYISQKKWNF